MDFMFLSLHASGSTCKVAMLLSLAEEFEPFRVGDILEASLNARAVFIFTLLSPRPRMSLCRSLFKYARTSRGDR